MIQKWCFVVVLAMVSAVHHPASAGAAPAPLGVADIPKATAKAIHAAVRHGEATVRIEGVDLGESEAHDLVLERFRATTPTTRFVAGSAQTPLAFDPETVRLYRGSIAGDAARRVVVAQHGDDVVGMINGVGGPRWISRGLTEGAAGNRVAAAPPMLCQVEIPGDAPTGRALMSTGVPVVPPTQRVIDLAVETDFEYFELFADADAAAAYVVMLYGVMSELYTREVDARIELVFVRIWEAEEGHFNGTGPLGEFRNFWERNMGDVDRDVAQMLSGRRDYPYGGAAWLASLCSGQAYSVTGYVNGQQPGHLDVSVFQYDLLVAAHELGHNCGALHTHDYRLDTCNSLMTVPQRGTIMSYCSQTVSGGNANTDMRFHTVVQDIMKATIAAAACIITDCNGNGEDDDADIRVGLSLDANRNGVPDECEDCNENGVLDTVDISNGTSLDLNGNAVPDECEPDCNGNGVPDDEDIASGTSVDAWGNGVPDECEEDCNANGVSDYSEIQNDLTLDVDRNTRLDACEDCNDDGTIDLEALNSAHFAWVANSDAQFISEVHSRSGVVSRVSELNGVSGTSDLIITASGRIFVSATAASRIIEFERSGAMVGTFVPTGLGGLANPRCLTFGPNGNLFVSSQGTSSVLEFDGTNGAFVRTFVASGAGGLTAPFGLAFGPNGNLFVTMEPGGVAEYDGATGAFIDLFVDPDDPANGGLSEPRSMLFLPNGNLLVASHGTNQVLEYDGATGNFARQFNRGGTDVALTLDGPWGLRLGPDGQVYVSRHHVHDDEEGGGVLPEDYEELHVNATRIYIFDVATGNFMRSYVTGHDTGIMAPTGFDFYPDLDGVDRNVNGLVDVCEITECPTDFDGNGATDFGDLLSVLSSWGPCVACAADVDGNDIVDFDDLLLVLSSWGPCAAGP